MDRKAGGIAIDRWMEKRMHGQTKKSQIVKI